MNALHSRAMNAPFRSLATLLLALTGCAGVVSPAAAAPEPCAGSVVFGGAAPGTTGRHRALETWLARYSEADLDEVLLDRDAIEALNARNAERPATWRDVVRVDPPAPEDVAAEIARRAAHMLRPFEEQRWIEETPGGFGAAMAIAESALPARRFHVVVHPADLRCVPEATAFYRVPADPAFDRNRCSTLQTGELVRVDRESPDGRWLYVHAGHGVGWLRDPHLTPPLSAEAALAFRDGAPRLVVVDDWVVTARGLVVRLGAGLPIVGRDDELGYHVVVPTVDGLDVDFVADTPAVREGLLPFTRRNVFSLLLRRLDDPYGWGDAAGGRDCSGLLLDAFTAFGLRLGRNSSVQAVAGARTVDVSSRDARAKRAAIRAAGRRGVVFLYMPGHIMLYLGDIDGAPWAISAISEVLVPCAGGGHRVIRLDRVEVTSLELGRGTERTAFIDRITTLAVFGP